MKIAVFWEVCLHILIVGSNISEELAAFICGRRIKGLFRVL
jgi:hypothetical protein